VVVPNTKNNLNLLNSVRHKAWRRKITPHIYFICFLYIWMWGAHSRRTSRGKVQLSPRHRCQAVRQLIIHNVSRGVYKSVIWLACSAGWTLSGSEGGLSSSLLGVEVWWLLPPGLYWGPDCGRGVEWCWGAWCWCCCWCWVSCSDHHCSNFRRHSSLGSGTWVPGAEWGVRHKCDRVICGSTTVRYIN
jgi:hypothetical protein